MFASKSMSDIGETIRAFIAKLSAYQSGLSQRERLLVLSLGFIALTLAPLSAHGLAQGAQDTVSQARLTLSEQSAIQNATSPAHARAVQASAAQIASWGWKAPSASVGRVLVEQQINTLAMAAGMTSIDLTADEKLTKVGPLAFARIQVNADFNWTTLSAFLRALTKTDKAILVRSIAVNGEMPLKVQLVFDAAITLDDTRS